MNEQADIAEQFLNEIKIDVMNSLIANGRDATHQTIKSLEVIITENGGQLLINSYADALEFGRGPTSPGAAKGDPTVFDRIKEWCAAKGIEDKAAWPITKKIHKEGYKGKPGVFTEPLSDDNINRRLNPVAEKIADLLGQKIIKAFEILETI